MKYRKVKFKMFVNNTHLYFVINNIRDTLTELNRLMQDTGNWISRKKKLNEKKSECIVMGIKHVTAKCSELKYVYINNEKRYLHQCGTWDLL